MAAGLAVIVVPVSVLKAMSVVEFSGGRGLLPITDLDTLFLDCSLIGIAWILFRRRHMIETWAFVWFGLALAVITAVLLGYVVTNFGTLVRMRYLVAAPVWALVLAVSPIARRFNPDRPGTI